MQKKLLAPDLESAVTQLSSTLQKEARLLKSKQLARSFFSFLEIKSSVSCKISVVFFPSSPYIKYHIAVGSSLIYTCTVHV